MTTPQWALIVTVTLVGMTVQSAVGFGFSFFVAPVLLAVQPSQVAVTALLALGLSINVLMLYGERRPPHFDRPSVAAVFVGAIPGMVGGVYALAAVSKSSLQIGLGLFIVSAGVLRLRDAQALPASPRRPAPAAAVGAVAGVLTSTTSLNGPPLVLWLARRPHSQQELRDTLTACFLALNVGGAILVTVLGSVHRSAQGLLLFAILTPAVFAGHQLGRHLFRRLGAARYRRIVTAAVVAAGLASIAFGTLSGGLR